jgi:mannosyl-3-phosphoglycerate phosphatase family protein
MSKIVIITDLDGTLLHPQTYSFKEAQPALQLIRKMKIPLIFCSSKTRAEIEVYRKKLTNHHPFISENGGGIFIPEEYFSFPVDGREYGNYKLITLGKPYTEIRKQFILLREKLGVKVQGFGDMTAKKIAELTHLSMLEANLACQRDFDEPFIFEDRRNAQFLQAIEGAGLQWTEGRLFHIMGVHDKGKAVDILKTFYQREKGDIQTIGLGDSLNDLPMLKTVDRPVLICHEDGTHDARVKVPALLKTKHAAASGWNEVILSLLNEMSAGDHKFN